MIRHLCIQSFSFFEDRCSSIAIENAPEPGDAYNAWSRPGAADRVPLPHSTAGLAARSRSEALEAGLRWPDGLQARVFAAAAWIRQQKHPFATHKRSDRVHRLTAPNSNN